MIVERVLRRGERRVGERGNAGERESKAQRERERVSGEWLKAAEGLTGATRWILQRDTHKNRVFAAGRGEDNPLSLSHVDWSTMD